jgi:hypothetical protein
MLAAMKVLPRILFCLLLPALLMGARAHADTPAALLAEGQAAYQRGDLPAAKRAFELVYQLDSHNAAAIGYLRRIKAQESGTGSAGSRQQKELATVILPQVQFREATLGSALESLKQQVTKVSGGKTNVSFVLQLPEPAAATTTVTLSLSNVPLPEALRYMGELANVSFSYEPYAIVVRPRAAAAAK